MSVQLLICFLNHSYMFYEFFLVIISSVTQLYPTLRDTMDCSTAVLPVHHQLSELTQAHVHWVSDAIQPCVIPFSSRLQSFPAPGSLSVLCNRWPKYWSYSFSIRTSNEYSGLIFFRMDWLHLLAVQGTLQSLLQHHSSKASILQRWTFCIVQLSHPYRTTGKTIALTR